MDRSDFQSVKTAPVHSPIVRALKAISPSVVCHSETGHDASVRVVSYRSDFDYLWDWSLEDEQSLKGWLCPEKNGLQPKRVLAVIWDGVPDLSIPLSLRGSPGLQLRKRSTVFDWATAFIQELSSPSAGAGNTRLRLLIVDVASYLFREAFGVRVFPAVTRDIRWLRVFRPIQAVEVERELCERLPDLLPVAADTRAPAEIHSGFCRLIEELRVGADDASVETSDPSSREFRELADLLKSLWMADLTRADGRHELSNIVGPLILEAALNPTRSQRSAIVNQLSALSLIPGGNESRGEAVRHSNPLNASIVEQDLFEQFRQLRVLIVDDHVNYGFGHFFASLLGVPIVDGLVGQEVHDGRNLTTHSDPKALLEHLNDIVDGYPPLQDSLVSECKCIVDCQVHQFDSEEPRLVGVDSTRFPPTNGFDVLVLDLRLYGAGGSRDREAEREFLGSLLKIYHKSCLCTVEDHALSRAAASAIHHIQPGGSSDTLEYLALLPLLLTAFDPSLPILVFSSTRQQVISNLLSSSPNIVLSFAKPSITGYDDRTPYIANLYSSLVTLLRKHEMRVVWKAITSLYANMDTRKPVPALKSLEATKSNHELRRFEPDRIGLRLLAGEYRNVMLTERYADALQIPGNWIEHYGLPPTVVQKKLLEMSKLGMLLSGGFESLSESTIEYYYEIRTQISKDNGAGLRAVVEEFQRMQEKSGQSTTHRDLDIEEGVVTDSDQNLRYVSTLRGPVGRTAGDIRLASVLCHPMGDQAVLRVIGDSIESRAYAEVASTVVSVLHGLRNLRAHYRIRAEHNEQVRTDAIWLWLWLIEGLFPQKPPAVRVKTARLEKLLHDNSVVKARTYSSSGRSEIESELRIRLGTVLRNDLVAIGDSRLTKPIADLLESGKSATERAPSHKCKPAPAEYKRLRLWKIYGRDASVEEIKLALSPFSVRKVLELEVPEDGATVLLEFCCGSTMARFKGAKGSNWVVVPGTVFALKRPPLGKAQPHRPGQKSVGKVRPMKKSSPPPRGKTNKKDTSYRDKNKSRREWSRPPVLAGEVTKLDGNWLTVVLNNGITVKVESEGTTLRVGSRVTVERIEDKFRVRPHS